MMKHDLVANLERFYPKGVDNLVICCSQPQRVLDKLQNLQCQNIFSLLPEKKETEEVPEQCHSEQDVVAQKDVYINLTTIKPATFFSKFVRPFGIINDAINLLILEVNSPYKAMLPCIRHGRWFPFCEVVFIITAPQDKQAQEAAERQAFSAKFIYCTEFRWGDDLCLSYSRGLFWQEYHAANDHRLQVEKESNKTKSKYYNLKVLYERLEQSSKAQIAELKKQLELLEAEHRKTTAALACLPQIPQSASIRTNELSVKNSPAEMLLEQASKLWSAANWKELASIKVHAFHHTRSYPSLLLLKAAAHYHLGQAEQSRRHFLLAQAKGVERNAAQSLVLSSIFASLSKVAYLQGDKDLSKSYQRQSLQMAGSLSDLEKFMHTQTMLETVRTNLPELTTDMIADEIANLEENLDENSPEATKLAILQSELSLVRHMLIQAYTRGLSISSNNKASSSETTNKHKTASLKELTQASPSQLGQDIWALQKAGYKWQGYFVEFGAADGILLSNTFLLEKEFGWNGICAEPNPSFNRELKRNRNCIVSDACIADKTGKTVSFVLANEYGGIEEYANNDMHSDKRGEYMIAGKTVKLETISLNDFPVRHNAPRHIDYMSIDTEGNEWDILKDFPLDEWDIRCLTIEHNDTIHKDEIRRFMAKHGYAFKAVEFEDWYYKEEQ